tara:strand:+ start:271 stop:513 length:243 start_codon:yes stop_codon:yes gene_type:complete
MTYYILLEGDKEEDAMFETNILGEESLGAFYPSLGFKMLHMIINQRPEYMEDLRIIDEQKKYHSITEFLDIVEKLRIKKA